MSKTYYVPVDIPLAFELICLKHWLVVRDHENARGGSEDFCRFVSAWAFCEFSRTLGRTKKNQFDPESYLKNVHKQFIEPDKKGIPL